MTDSAGARLVIACVCAEGVSTVQRVTPGQVLTSRGGGTLGLMFEMRESGYSLRKKETKLWILCVFVCHYGNTAYTITQTLKLYGGYMPTGLMTSQQVNDELMSRRVCQITVPYCGNLPDYTRDRSPLSSHFYTNSLSLCVPLSFGLNCCSGW